MNITDLDLKSNLENILSNVKTTTDRFSSNTYTDSYKKDFNSIIDKINSAAKSHEQTSNKSLSPNNSDSRNKTQIKNPNQQNLNNTNNLHNDNIKQNQLTDTENNQTKNSTAQSDNQNNNEISDKINKTESAPNKNTEESAKTATTTDNSQTDVQKNSTSYQDNQSATDLTNPASQEYTTEDTPTTLLTEEGLLELQSQILNELLTSDNSELKAELYQDIKSIAESADTPDIIAELAKSIITTMEDASNSETIPQSTEQEETLTTEELLLKTELDKTATEQTTPVSNNDESTIGETAEIARKSKDLQKNSTVNDTPNLNNTPTDKSTTSDLNGQVTKTEILTTDKLETDYNKDPNDTQKNETAVINEDIEILDDVEILEDKINLKANDVTSKSKFEKETAEKLKSLLKELNAQINQTSSENTGESNLQNRQSAQEELIKITIDGLEQNTKSNNTNKPTINFAKTFAQTTTPKDISQENIISQIYSKLQNLQQGSKMVMTLNPEFLGKVQIELINTKSGLMAQMSVSTGTVKDVLSKDIDGLKTALNSQGISVDSITVKLSETTEPSGKSDYLEQEKNKEDKEQGFSKNKEEEEEKQQKQEQFKDIMGKFNKQENNKE